MWNFDPEQIAAGEPDWWWNPLSYVTSDRRALELTDAFVGAYRDPDARPDPFFDPAGQELVSHLLRAAALDDRPITQAFLWSTRPNDDEPARILQEHGLELAAASVLDHVHAPFEQRGGVYGTARQILSFLRDPDIARWVTAAGPPTAARSSTSPRSCRAADTLYLHSKEGQGSSAGLVTALAMALCDAAEQLAKRSPGGRLPVPLVGVLDEAANICRWRAAARPVLALRVARDPAADAACSRGRKARRCGDRPGCASSGAPRTCASTAAASAEEEFLSDLEKLIGEYNRMVASPSQPARARRRQHQHQLAADPDADPDRRRPRRAAARPDHRDALRRAAGARQADLLVEHQPGQPDPGVDRGLRPRRSPRPPPRPQPTQEARGRRTSLNGASADALAGAGPLVEQTVAQRARAARRLDDRARRSTAGRAGCSTPSRSSELARRPPSGSSPTWPTRPASTT